MIAASVAAGLDPEAIWRITPAELRAWFDGKAKARREEHRERIALAWQINALHRTKTLPPLAKLLPGAQPKRMTDQQLTIAGKALYATLGGNVEDWAQVERAG